MSDDARYRLAPVRDVRERAEAVRRGDLATAVGDARETESRRADAHTRVGSARVALAAARATAASAETAAQRTLAERFVARRRRDLDDARDALARADASYDERLGVVDVARARLAHARAERELIERHFARWRETQQRLAERRADD
jgi:hypothetical protein